MGADLVTEKVESKISFIFRMSSLRLLSSLVNRATCSPRLSTISSPLTSVSMVSPSFNHYRSASGKASKWKIWKSKEEPIEENGEASEMELYQQQVDQMEKEAKAEYIQSKRNKSKPSASDRQILHGEPPYAGLMFEYNNLHRSKEYKRSMLSKHGVAKTGVEPGIVWPTEKEVVLAREWEELYQDKPLIDQIRDAKRNIEKRKEDRIARELVVDQNLSKMDAQVKQWREKVLAELKLEFGYNINPEDNYMKGRIAERKKK